MANIKRVAIILAGGEGTRLWPLSDVTHPKSLLEVFTKKSMLEGTVARARLFADEVFVLTNQTIAQKAEPEFTRLRLPKGDIIIEPDGADTAAAIAFAIEHIKRTLGDQTAVVLLPVDHQIRNYGAFYRDVKYAISTAIAARTLTLFGVTPSYAATGYGYIQLGKALGRMDRDMVFAVSAFLEKPDKKTAMQFLHSADHVWNSGMYIGLVEAFESAFKANPELHAWYKKLTSHRLAPMPEELRKLQFESSVIEHARKLQAVIATFDWSDIGTYDELYRTGPHTDENDNSTKGNTALEDCQQCLVIGNRKKIVALGLKDIAIIDGPNGILVCKKSTHAQIVGRVATGKMQPGAKE